MMGKQPLTNRDASGRVHCSYSHLLHMNNLTRQNTLIDDPDQLTQAPKCRMLSRHLLNLVSANTNRLVSCTRIHRGKSPSSTPTIAVGTVTKISRLDSCVTSTLSRSRSWGPVSFIMSRSPISHPFSVSSASPPTTPPAMPHF